MRLIPRNLRALKLELFYFAIPILIFDEIINPKLKKAFPSESEGPLP